MNNFDNDPRFGLCAPADAVVKTQISRQQDIAHNERYWAAQSAFYANHPMNAPGMAMMFPMEHSNWLRLTGQGC